MRNIRDQNFCWQEKKVNRLIRDNFKLSELSKMKLLYATLTEIQSDFNCQEIKWYTKTISTYSGLSKDFIPTGLKKLEELKIIKIVQEKENGKYKGKTVIFTPENIKGERRKTSNGKVGNGKTSTDKTANGITDSSEHSTYIEHSDHKEHSSYKEDNKENAKAYTSFLKKETTTKTTKVKNEIIEKMLEDGAKTRRRPFFDIPTQRKYINDLLAMGIKPKQIMRAFFETLESDYWRKQDRLPDFKTVFSVIKNKKY